MASYKDAIEWIAENDDTEFLDDVEVDTMSVTLSMVVDLWNKDETQAKRDLRNAIKRVDKREAKAAAARAAAAKVSA